MKYILSVFVIIFCLSCRNNTPPNTVKEKVKETDSLGTAPLKAEQSKDTNMARMDSSAARLVVFFYSIGSGIETGLMKAFEDSIASYSERFNKAINYQKTPWGREGETDFCLMLNELTPSEQDQFIAMTRAHLKNAKWVNIKENYPCINRKK